MKRLLSILLAAALLAAPVSAGAAAGGAAVVDGYVYQTSSDGMAVEYRVPQVTLSGAGVAALNAAIWQDVYDGYVAGALLDEQSGYWPGLMGIGYSWASDGDVLSICADVSYAANDLHDYHVYNMSLSAGERMSDRELFAAVGVTREQFNVLMREAISSRFSAMPSYPDDGGFTERQRQLSLSDDNIALSAPYLGAGGALCAVGRIYPVAGPECCWEQFILIPGKADSRLVSFLDRCDSQYLTEADIAGFDAKMCEYARNGVYARSGRGFQSAELREFFSQFDWYRPTVDPALFSESMLNDYQIKNIALVMNYEQSHGY